MSNLSLTNIIYRLWVIYRQHTHRDLYVLSVVTNEIKSAFHVRRNEFTGHFHVFNLLCLLLVSLQGYRPTVFYPKRPNKQLYQNLTSQCEKMDIPFLSYFPGDTQLITDSYNLIIDAFFGFSFKAPIRGDFGMYLSQLIKAGVPICSIDVPSGQC